MTIFVAGDSTAANKDENRRPESGWGEQLGGFVPQSVIVKNFALNGRSSKSFIDEGVLDQIKAEISEGDIFVIQFGHNDEKDDPARHTDPESTFPEYLMRYVSVARAVGAQSILITPISRLHFAEDGTLKDTHTRWAQAIRDLAVREKLPLVDMSEKTFTLFSTLGEVESARFFLRFPPRVYPNYPDGITDNTHFCREGAQKMASLIVADIVSLLDLDWKVPSF